MQFISLAPGPSQISEATKKDMARAVALNIPSLSHRSEGFYKLFRETRKGLVRFLGLPSGYNCYFVSSATECMEIAARNFCKKGSFHFSKGAFSKRFCEISGAVKNKTGFREVAAGEEFDYSKERVDEKKFDLVGINYTETPTGVTLAWKELAVFRKRHSKMIIAVDVVSAVAMERIRFSLADVWFFSVQKGFGLPAGLGVLIVNERALKKAQALKVAGKDVGGFHSVADLEERALKSQTISTPNIFNLFLLHRQAERFWKKGARKLEQETRRKADFLYAWAEKQGLELCAKEKKYQSRSVLCLAFPEGVAANKFHQKINRQGLFVGAGYAEMKETHFRLANFCAIRMKDLRKAVKIIEEAL